MNKQSIEFLSGDSMMTHRVREFDWTVTPLGPPECWPDALKTALSIMLGSHFPQALVWGEKHITFYNDAFIPILGDKPFALGKPFGEIWSESWETIGPICDAAFEGQATFIENFPLLIMRGQEPEKAYFTFCYSPVSDASGQVVGMLDTVIETTPTVLALESRRRLDFLDELAQAMQQATNASQLLAITTRLVAGHLSLSNCAYADMDPDQNGFTIRGDMPSPGTTSTVGHYRLTDFGEGAVSDLSAGQPYILNDLSGLPADQAAMFRSIGVEAVICMPLIKKGRLTALMAIHDNAPRPWSDYDLSLLREVTERSWAHIERVRLEEQFRRAEEAGGVGLFTVDIATGIVHGTDQFHRIFGLGPAEPLPAETFERLVLPEDSHFASSRQGRVRGDTELDVQYRISRANDGEIRAISRKGEYERDASGKPRRLLGAVRDITAQWQAQRALAESEAQFRTLAQAMPTMVWTARADGMLDWFNDQVYAYSGAKLGTLNERGWGARVHPDDLPDTLARWQQSLIDGTIYEAEFRLLRHDGEYRWHLARATPIRDEDGVITRWVGTNTDIHERVLSSDASERDRERMWAMSQDLLLVCDLNGIITDVNPTVERVLGWTPTEFIGQSLMDFIHPEDFAATEDELARLSEGETVLHFENRYRDRHGDYHLLDWTAVPDGGRVHAVGRDITESRLIARDHERIWSLSPVLKCVASLDATLLKVNPAWTGTLGWKGEDVTGRPLIDFIVDADREKAGATLERLMLGETLSEQELTFLAKDGDERQIAWNFVAESGSIFGFGRDITEQRNAENALRQSQKMEAVGQLTGGIAHDFNNLLQGVSGNLELLQRRIDQGRMDGLERFIKGAATSTSRAAALTHRLLAFSRRQPLDPRPVRANPLVSSMEDLLRRTMGEAIDLELVLAGGLWLTKCDPNQLESAVLNLAINARDAMPEGGTLTIETCNAHLDNAYTARQRDLTPGQYVCICVTDTGTGMDADTMARAFEPFFTTKPIGQGTGLGLSMIYGFTRQSEGYAKIYSEPGKGTTVKIYLPRYRGEAADEEIIPQLSAEHATDAGETVLVVEDEPVVRGLIVEVLSELGYRAIEAVDGPSGLQILQSKRRIDLLVTDIGLPGLNGRQVADAARIARPHLKILFMTGYAENAALASGFLEPGMEMITKPFAMEALASRIRDMIERG